MTFLRLAFHPRAVGLLRAATGILFVGNPQGLSRTWVGDATPETTSLVRSVGARDAVIGAGLLTTGTLPWLTASVVSDLGDAVEAAFGDGVPDERKREVLGWAGGFAAYAILSWVINRSELR